MYRYVSKNQVASYEKKCREILLKVQKTLKKKYKLTMQIYLIGSGAKKLVTQNEKGIFDLDYNLVLQKYPAGWDGKKLKDVIRAELDKVIPKDFSRGQDSTSAITYKYPKNTANIKYGLDIGIIGKIERTGNYCRLIHDKSNNQYVWNDIPRSKDVSAKMRVIKNYNLISEVKELYLQKKNQYLRRNDEKPSFIIYVETVNEIYNKLG